MRAGIEIACTPEHRKAKYVLTSNRNTPAAANVR